MLPTMQPMEKSRTKGARTRKRFEEVHIGPVRLYFSHFELIAFQLDGAAPVVCAILKPMTTNTGMFVEHHRLHLEPDKAKWLSRNDFEKRWMEVSEAIFKVVR